MQLFVFLMHILKRIDQIFGFFSGSVTSQQNDEMLW